MDEVDDGTETETAGERLRAAREAQGLTLDAIAAQTRIPTRHLAAIEASEWSTLPAPVYSIGFAKNYAAIVGLDRAEIADQIRFEMGGTRPVSIQPEVFQPADPKRSMPKWLIVGAVIAVLLLLALLNYLRSRELEPTPTAAPQAAIAPAPTPTAAPAIQAPPTSGPVTIAALDAPVWIRVRNGGQTLKIGNLAPGERFDLPATATAPLLDAGRPEGLKITVSGRDVPAIGKSGRPVSQVSLLPADLAKGGATATATATGQPAPTATSNVAALPAR